MKKTFTININGTVFHIEEDAYDVLQNYLSTLKNHFGTDDEGNEIISDIEARIGEIFNEKSSEVNKVVTIDWVNYAISIMGAPEDIVNEEGAAEPASTQIKRQKRLYRDPEQRIIGGVCGGLGAYFNIDPLILRIIFIVLFFAGGAAFLAYLILWIAVPKARTTGQLLEMRGQEATVKNIKNWVKEEEKDVKETYRNFKSSDTYASGKRGVETAGAVVSDGLSVLMRVIIILIGAFLIVTSFIGLIALISSLVIGNVFSEGWTLGPTIFLNHFIDPGTITWGLFAIGLVSGIPLLALLFIGSKMIFRYKSNNAAIGLGMAGVWLLALVSLIVLSAGQIGNFKKQSVLTRSETISCNSCQTLYLKAGEDKYKDYSETDLDMDDIKVKVVNGKDIMLGEPKIDIKKSETDEFSILIKTSSRGKTVDESKELNEKILYHYDVKDSTLLFDPWFLLGDNIKWRNQEVDITIRVPEGKSVFINENMDRIIHNVDNVSNTWDGDMVGKYWVMLPEGLTMKDSIR